MIVMRGRIQLQGKNTAEKLSHVERILASFVGRLSRTVIGIIPPVPFMSYVAEPEGDILATFLVPISGVIDQAYLRIGNYDSKPINLEITIITGVFKHVVTLECQRPSHVFDINWRVEAGDLITVRGGGVHEVHVAFAVQPDLARAVKERHMIEGFRALLEEEGANNGVHE